MPTPTIDDVFNDIETPGQGSGSTTSVEENAGVQKRLRFVFDSIDGTQPDLQPREYSYANEAVQSTEEGLMGISRADANLIRGAVGGVGAIMQGPHAIAPAGTNDDGTTDRRTGPVYDAGESLQQWAGQDDTSEAMPQTGLGAALQSGIPRGVGQAADIMGATIAGGPVAGATVGSLMAAGDSYRDGKREGLSDEDSHKYARIMAAVGTTSFIPLGQIGEASAPVRKVIATQIMRRIAVGGVEGGAQGALQGFVGELTKRSLKDPSKPMVDIAAEAIKDPMLWEGAGTNAAVAALLGGGTGAIETRARQAEKLPAPPQRDSVDPDFMPDEQSAPPTPEPEAPAEETGGVEPEPVEPPAPEPEAGGLAETTKKGPEQGSVEDQARQWAAANPEAAAKLAQIGQPSRGDFEKVGLNGRTSNADVRKQFAAVLRSLHPPITGDRPPVIAPEAPAISQTPPVLAPEPISAAPEPPAAQEGPPAAEAAPEALPKPEPPKPEPPKEPEAPPRPVAPIVRGARQDVAIPGEESVPATYALMPLSSIAPSHDPLTFEKNPEHPLGNTRDYTGRKDLQEQVARHAQKLDTDILLDRGAGNDRGGPVVTKEGVVLGGNSRAMKLLRAAMAKGESFKAYTAALKARAAEFGLKPEDVQADSVLVRVLDDQDAARQKELVPRLNRGAQNAESDQERAFSLAGQMNDGFLKGVDVGEDETLNAALRRQGSDVFTLLRKQGIVSEADFATFVDKDGKLTKRGSDILEQALVAKVIGSLDLYNAMTDSQKQTVVRVGAPILAVAKEVGLGHVDPSADIRTLMPEVIKAWVERGSTEGQSSIFGDQLSPEQSALLDLMRLLERKKKFARPMMSKVANELTAGAKSTKGEKDFLGDAPPPDVAAILNAAARELRSAKTRKLTEGSLFDANGRPRAQEVESGNKAAYVQPKGGAELERITPGEKGDPIADTDVIASMERIWGIPIRRGKLSNRGANGEYDTHSHVSRSRGNEANPLSTQAHEIAHHIDNVNGISGSFNGGKSLLPEAVKAELRPLDYKPEMRRVHEGFAEFVRHYLTRDDAATFAPKAYDWFTKTFLPANPDVAARLSKTRELLDRWRGMTPEQEVMSKLSFTGKQEKPEGVSSRQWIAEKVHDQAHRTYQKLKFEGHFLSLLTKEAKSRGYKVKEGDEAESLFLAQIGNGPVYAASALEHGVFDLQGDENGIMKQIGPSLNDAIGKIKPDEYEDFVRWAYANHAVESWKKGKNPGISPEAAKTLASKAHPAEWDSATKKLTEFNNALITMLENVGTIPANEAQAMRDYWETYLPLHRVMDAQTIKGKMSGGTKLVNLRNPVSGRHGSNLKVLDPVQATVERAIRFYTVAARQLVVNSLVDMATKTDGLGGWIEKVPPGTQVTQVGLNEMREVLSAADVDTQALDLLSDDTKFLLYRPNPTTKSGEPIGRFKGELYRIDPDLFNSIAGLSGVPTNFFGKLSRILVSSIKLGATGVSPDFAAVDSLRNYMNFLGNRVESKGIGGALDPGAFVASYIYSEFLGGKEDPVVKMWKANGGELSQRLGMDRDSIQRSVDRAMGVSSSRRALMAMTRGDFRKALVEGAKAGHNGVDVVRQFLGVSDASLRLAEFASYLKNHGYSLNDVRTGKVEVPRNVQIAATNAAGDVNTNFRRTGSWTKQAEAYLPYLNASIEPTDRFIRLGLDPKTRKKLWTRAAVVAALSLGYWFNQKDQDARKEMPPYLKYGFWTWYDDEGNPTLRIAKPEQFGWIIGSAVEAIADAIYQKDPGALKDYGEALAKKDTPNLLPPIVSIPAGAYFNWDFFRERPVEDRGMAGRPKPDRYDEFTTLLARQLGKWTGQSPQMIDYLSSATTGGLYDRVVRPTEALATGKGMTLQTAPVTNRFLFKREYNVSVDEFYDALARADEKVAGAKFSGNAASDQDKDLQKKLHDYNDLMKSLRDATGATPEIDARKKSDRYLIGLSRRALGKPALDRYPDPLTSEDLPPELKAARDKFLGSQVMKATAPEPDGSGPKHDEWQAARDRANDFLSGLSYGQKLDLLEKASARRGMGASSAAYQSRVSGL